MSDNFVVASHVSDSENLNSFYLILSTSTYL